MNRAQHSTNNAVLGAPNGVAIDHCGALPITRVEVDGMPMVISYWQPDYAELQRLINGKAVMLWVWGTTHAPVAMGVDT